MPRCSPIQADAQRTNEHSGQHWKLTGGLDALTEKIPELSRVVYSRNIRRGSNVRTARLPRVHSALAALT